MPILNLPVYIDQPSLESAVIGIRGITDADGNVAGTSLVDSGLIGFLGIENCSVIVNPGRIGQVVVRPSIAFNAAIGEISFAPTAGFQVTAGTEYIIINIAGGGGGGGGGVVGIVALTGLATGGAADQLDDNVNITQANDYWNGQLLLMLTGNNAGLSRPIIDSILANNRLVVSPAFPNAVVAGDGYAIVMRYQPVVPAADAVAIDLERDVIGNKADTANLVINNTSSIMRYIKGLVGMAVFAGGNEYYALYAKPDDLLENTAFDFDTQFPALAGRRIKSIALFLDLNNLTQSATLRLKVAVDGVNLRNIETLNWLFGDEVGIYFNLNSCNINFSVTVQSLVLEGAARDIPVRVVFEQMEP